ncbi:MAG: YigZ family protein [Burkholderiales bacterium]|nr:YigZ family protein [Burkholderiales bacterium]
MANDIATVPKLEPGKFHRTEQTIKKSRFITSVSRASSTEEAKRFVDQIRSEFPDARHNCWAFNAGLAGSTAKVGCSDDGEPKGTAGRPMLTVLLHSGISEIVAVVTRYFGGILLGTGGLVKAYQSSVKINLETLPVAEKISMVLLKARLPYSALANIQNMLPRYGASIAGQSFSEDVELVVSTPEETASDLISFLKTNGCTISTPIK